MTDDQIQSVLSTSRAWLERLANFAPGQADVIRDIPAPRRLDESERREWQLPPKPEPEPPEPGLDTAPIDWAAVISASIEAALASERRLVAEALGASTGELLDEVRREFEQKIAELKREQAERVAKLRTEIAEYRIAAAGNHRGVLDLPNPPAGKSVN